MIINYKDALLEYSKKGSLNQVTKNQEFLFRLELIQSIEVPLRILWEFLIFSKDWDFYLGKDQRNEEIWFFEVIRTDEVLWKIVRRVEDMNKMKVAKKVEWFKYVINNMWKIDWYWSRKVSQDDVENVLKEMLGIVEKYLNE